MKINADLIIELRKAKSWSQDELAIAAGVNLRTIQRVESEGAASLQSKKALASAFDIEVNDLDYQEKPITMKYEYKVLKFDLKGVMSRKVNSSDMEAQLNQHGAEGWELFHISEILENMGQTGRLIATMKRALP
jgi:transcriptional regulator with XRE-family HTH domain